MKNKTSEDKYLHLLKKVILNKVYLDDELRLNYLRDCIAGKHDFDYVVYHDIRAQMREQYNALERSREIGQFLQRDIHRSGFSHTMVGQKRLDNLHHCLDHIRQHSVPGDLVECGVWRGGCCIFMVAYLELFLIEDRKVFAADSFDGLPKSTHQEDIFIDLSKETYPELAVSQSTVKENLESYDLSLDYVEFLQGWFKNTLPLAPIEKISLLRLDGDLYESTMDCLNALYDKVVEGGIVIIDDWVVMPPCKKAVEDFFENRGEMLPKMTEIDWSAVFWVKGND